MKKITKKRESQPVGFPPKIGSILGKVAKGSIYLLVFLLPLFFLPFTVSILDFNKQILLFVLLFISLISWLAKMLIEGRAELNLTILNIPVITLVLLTGLSVLFSFSKSGSFWGWPLNISDGFVTLFAFAIFYFLIANLFLKKNEIFYLYLVLICSAFLATVFGGLQLFGKFVLPFDFARNNSFNTIGTVNSSGIFLSIILSITVGLIFAAEKIQRKILFIFSLLFLSLLILINIKTIWIVLISGSAFYFVFGLFNIKKSGETNWLILPMTLIILAMFLTFVRDPLTRISFVPAEVSLSHKATFDIAKEALKGKSLILGTGPGTFIYNYSRFKPLVINQTLFWSIRFDSGASEVLDKLINTGILGTLSFLCLLLIILWEIVNHSKKAIPGKEGANYFLSLAIFAGATAVITSYFLYPANISLSFLFWLSLGSIAALEKEKIRSLELKTNPSLTLVLSFLLVLSFIFGTGFLFLTGQRYLAEINYLQASISLQRGEVDNSINLLSMAINLNQDVDVYWRDLSQAYLQKLNQDLQDSDISQEALEESIQSLTMNSINAAKRATDIDSQNVANWSVQGFVCQNIIGFMDGAEDCSLNSYEKALELEPSNPYFFTEIGRVYLNKAILSAQQEEKEEALNKARKSFERAVQLKPDYVLAHFQIALLHQLKGETKEAILKLEETKRAAPNDIGVAFQLGFLYYSDNQLDRAQKELERTVNLALQAQGDYANARYLLGLVYDKQGKREEAIEQFEKVQENNPDNQEINKILDNLRNGKPALEGVVSSQLPIEETPPERLSE